MILEVNGDRMKRKTIDFIGLVFWLLGGICVLIDGEVSLLVYFLTWITLLILIIEKVLRNE